MEISVKMDAAEFQEFMEYRSDKGKLNMGRGWKRSFPRQRW